MWAKLELVWADTAVKVMTSAERVNVTEEGAGDTEETLTALETTDD